MTTSQRRDDAADAIDSRWEMNDLLWGIIHMATFGRPGGKQSMSVWDEKKVVIMRKPIWLSFSLGREASNRTVSSVMQMLKAPHFLLGEGSLSFDYGWDNVVKTWTRSNDGCPNSGSSTSAIHPSNVDQSCTRGQNGGEDIQCASHDLESLTSWLAGEFYKGNGLVGSRVLERKSTCISVPLKYLWRWT